MNILLVGNKAVYETYLTATLYLHQQPEKGVLGNLELESRKVPIKVGQDIWGNQVFILGNSAPQQVILMNTELNRIDNWSGSPILVTTVKPSGVWLTLILAKLSLLPAIGTIFNKLACRWTLFRHQELEETAHEISLKVHEYAGPGLEAAKPLIQKNDVLTKDLV